MDYLVAVLISRFDINVPGNSQRILDLIFPILNNMDQLDRGKCLTELSNQFNSSLENVRAMFEVISQSKQSNGSDNQKPINKSSRVIYLLALIFQIQN